MRRLTIASTIMLLLCGRISGETVSSGTADDLTAVRGAATDFAVAAYSKTDKGDDNFVFSPLIISIGLGVVYGGAREKTGAELANAIQTDLNQARYQAAFSDLRGRINTSLQKSRVMLSVAKLVAHQQDYPLRESFVSLARDTYGCETIELDFQKDPGSAVRQLNLWVSKRTRGKITSFVPQSAITPDTVLAILNAIYFKATWANVFDEELTKDRTFWPSEKKSREVPTMYQKEKFAYGETPSEQVLELPYMGHGVSMLVVLPKERAGLAALERRLSAKDVVSWVSSLAPSDKYEVETYLPKFEMETDMDLTRVLRAMGAKRMFSPREADLTGMSPRKPLFISTALHRAGVKVDEKGTEAWAATGFFATLGVEWEKPPTKVFRADHPFLFFILDRSNGVILFMGRVMSPETPDRTTTKSTLSPEAAPSAAPSER